MVAAALPEASGGDKKNCCETGGPAVGSSSPNDGLNQALISPRHSWCNLFPSALLIYERQISCQSTFKKNVVRCSWTPKSAKAASTSLVIMARPKPETRLLARLAWSLTRLGSARTNL
jgi:hypothetical protein